MIRKKYMELQGKWWKEVKMKKKSWNMPKNTVETSERKWDKEEFEKKEEKKRKKKTNLMKVKKCW